MCVFINPLFEMFCYYYYVVVFFFLSYFKDDTSNQVSCFISILFFFIVNYCTILFPTGNNKLLKLVS